MTWAEIVRLWFDQLFHSKREDDLREQVAYLRSQLEQSRIERDRLQLLLNNINPAGEILRRREHPPAKPTVPAPGPKRWDSVLSERLKENAIWQAEEAKKKEIAAKSGTSQSI